MFGAVQKFLFLVENFTDYSWFILTAYGLTVVVLMSLLFFTLTKYFAAKNAK